MRLSAFFLTILLAICAYALPRKRSPMDSCRELIVVTTSEWNSSEVTLRRYVRANIRVPWQAVGQPITVMVGKSGLGWGTGLLAPPRESSDPVKKEGDGRAPAGAFRLSKAFGYASQEKSGWKMPYVSLTPTIECVDDEESKFYNTLVDTTAVSADWGSHKNEKMRRADDLYRWGILVDHNVNPPVAGGGSCIFMHIWRGPGQPTVGCTAMEQADLELLLGWLDPKRKPLLVQLPASQYQKLRHRWNLPGMER